MFLEEYDDAGTRKWHKKRSQDTNYDVEYEIRYITSSAKYARIIEEMLITVFGARKLVDAYDDAESVVCDFWLMRRGQFDVSGDDFLERGVKYEAVNINIEGSEIVRTNIPETTDFELDGDPLTHDEMDDLNNNL